MIYSFIFEPSTNSYKLVEGVSRFTPYTSLLECEYKPSIEDVLSLKVKGESSGTIKFIRKENFKHRTLL